jgi:F5/8 type C domain-containing protein
VRCFPTVCATAMRRGSVAIALVSAMFGFPISPMGCARGIDEALEPGQAGSSGNPTGPSSVVGDGRTGAATSTVGVGGSGGNGASGGTGASAGSSTGASGADAGAGGAVGAAGSTGGGATLDDSATGGRMGSSDGGDERASDSSTPDGSSPDSGTPCSTNPLSLKTTWIASSSQSSLGNSTEADPLYNPPSHAIDGNINERWSTGNAQAGNEWLQIDFGRTVAIDRVTLQLGVDTGDYPRGYTARFSSTPLNFTAPVLVFGCRSARRRYRHHLPCARHRPLPDHLSDRRDRQLVERRRTDRYLHGVIVANSKHLGSYRNFVDRPRVGGIGSDLRHANVPCKMRSDDDLHDGLTSSSSDGRKRHVVH